MRWSVFDGVPEDDVRQVLSIARRRTFRRGEVVFHAGDPADTLHLIVAGRFAVRVQTQSPHGGMAITKWMHEYLANRLDLTFTDIGPTELKHVAKTVRLFVWHPDRVVKPAEIAAATATVSSASG